MRTLAVLATLTLALAVGSSFAEKKADDAKAAIGQPAPAFALKDLDGNEVKLQDHAGKIVVLEWFNPECPTVVRHYQAKTMTSLQDKYKDKDVVWLAVASGATAKEDVQKASRKFLADHHATQKVLLDPDRAVAGAYQAKTTPHLFIINKDGTLAYRGGIDDDDASGSKGDKAVNYVDKALAALTANQSVAQAETKPYGCSVK